MTPSSPQVFVDNVGFDAGVILASRPTPLDELDAREAVAAAYNAGVRFFDAAHFDGSGRSEELLGETLACRRSQIRLSTKGGVGCTDPTDPRTLRCDASYDSLRASLERSLRRLRTDHVDAYLLQQPDPALTPEQQMEHLQHLRDDGLAEEVGFCNFGPDACARALATGIPSVVGYGFSLLDRRHEQELDEAGARGCTRVTYGAFAHGLLWQHFDLAAHDAGASGHGGADASRRLGAIADGLDVSIAALLVTLSVQERQTDVALVGCRRPSEVRDCMRALSLELDADTRREICDVLVSVDGPAPHLMGVTT